MSNLDPKTVWVHALAAATLIAGYLVAFIPAWAPAKQDLIVGGAVLGAGAILLAHAIRYKKPGQTDLQAVETTASDVLSESDVEAIVEKKLVTMATAGSKTPQPVASETTPAAAAQQTVIGKPTV